MLSKAVYGICSFKSYIISSWIDKLRYRDSIIKPVSNQLANMNLRHTKLDEVLAHRYKETWSVCHILISEAARLEEVEGYTRPCSNGK